MNNLAKEQKPSQKVQAGEIYLEPTVIIPPMRDTSTVQANQYPIKMEQLPNGVWRGGDEELPVGTWRGGEDEELPVGTWRGGGDEELPVGTWRIITDGEDWFDHYTEQDLKNDLNEYYPGNPWWPRPIDHRLFDDRVIEMGKRLNLKSESLSLRGLYE